MLVRLPARHGHHTFRFLYGPSVAGVPSSRHRNADITSDQNDDRNTSLTNQEWQISTRHTSPAFRIQGHSNGMFCRKIEQTTRPTCRTGRSATCISVSRQFQCTANMLGTCKSDTKCISVNTRKLVDRHPGIPWQCMYQISMSLVESPVQCCCQLPGPSVSPSRLQSVTRQSMLCSGCSAGTCVECLESLRSHAWQFRT